MVEIGQDVRRLVAPRPFVFAALALAISIASSVWARAFAIDDAFIGIRYARHLAAGDGYAWNIGGPATDGVTPLPWAFLLWPLAHAGALTVLARSRVMGAAIWALAASLWGLAVGRTRAPAWVKLGLMGVLALDVPVAAHAVSGMETALAMALATVASISHAKGYRSAVCAGLAASLRPELVVWALVLSVGFARVEQAPLRKLVLTGLVAFAPFAACAAIRLIVFGRPGPLALLAKPSDVGHGVAYAGAAFFFSLAPVLLVSPRALAKERGPGLVIALSTVAHFTVAMAVGGDWMPYARLLAPVVPAMLFAAALASVQATRVCVATRFLVALALGGFFFVRSAPVLRHAGEDRVSMIHHAPEAIARAQHPATVDIGWVSAVTDAPILDLAGVTDPDIATLPGGHTSKRVDTLMLLARGVDVAIFYADPLPTDLAAIDPSVFARVVEARIVRDPVFDARFAATALLPLGARGAGYVIFSRR
jgi:hypothetical protein